MTKAETWGIEQDADAEKQKQKQKPPDLVHSRGLFMSTANKTPPVTGTTISPDSFEHCGVLTSTAENPKTPHLELIIGILAGWGQAAAPGLGWFQSDESPHRTPCWESWWSSHQTFPAADRGAPGTSLRTARSRDRPVHHWRAPWQPEPPSRYRAPAHPGGAYRDTSHSTRTVPPRGGY